jgi:hypothetical protein
LRLKDFEDEILLAESAGARQFQSAGDLGQLGNIFFFQFCDGHIHLQDGFFSGGILSGEFVRRVGTRRSSLSSPPLRLGKILRLAQDVMAFRTCNPIENLVHGFLDAGVGTMKFPRCLRGQLAEHVPVPQSLDCVKYTIRAHLP